MSGIIVVYHSGTGRTKKLAEAIAKSANAELMDVNEPDWDKLDAAAAIIIGAPTYMGSVSAPMKAFMDATGGRWVSQKWKNKIAGGFTNASYSSGDKLNALIQIAIFAMQHSMIWVGSDTMPEGDLNRMGSFFGVMSQSLQKTSAEDAMNKGDLQTAKLYGKRVAEMVSRFAD
ncbi:MAG: NADPH-dependent FMN reductase [Alphaproteobacteria bacterium CG11_big_fil_rev_8_21_14_0_20_44_7]|nr:MAG: NADPH-dependent FMN reductase [Alphaproteobacteria bacterium CG11_big_fil_rev_8_21_14_0_20_44_7]